MSLNYKSDEVFEMACEIERRGAGFYHKAADQCSDKEVKDLFHELEKMENRHEETFRKMQKEYTDGDEDAVFDPDDEMNYYLREIAGGRGWEGKASPADELTGNESMDEILEIAIAAEKDSINFYLGIKESIDSDKDKEAVEAIIREEMEHVAKLTKYLSNVE